MNVGVDMVIGDFIFEFDNTVLDFDPSLFMDIYRHLLQGFDIVSASPSRSERLTSSPVAGWTTTSLFLLSAFFGWFSILTIIIKYLQMIIDLVLKREYYSFETVEKLTK